VDHYLVYNLPQEKEIFFYGLVDGNFKQILNPLGDNTKYNYKELQAFGDNELLYLSVSKRLSPFKWFSVFIFVIASLIFSFFVLFGVYLKQLFLKRNEVESMVIEKTRQLASSVERLKVSNHDLDRFVYVASHDLRSPLRGIENLSKWISEDEESSLSKDSAENFDLLLIRVKRMGALLTSLLLYSRLGRDEEKLQWIDVRKLVFEIFEILNGSEHFKLTYLGVEPKILLKKAVLTHVVQNLLENSIKHYGADHGKIEICVEEHSDHYKFSVTDRGKGFHIKYKDKIFEMFKTLEPRDKVEGSGMGLTLIRKSLEQEGGKIWVSKVGVGQGVTFCFIWPRCLGVK
jgi:light-regulated signal transduction histidine kinase (bacteriophytochrome)